MLKHKQHQTIILTGTAVALGLAGIVGTTIPAQATGSEVKIDVNVRDTVSLAIYPHGDHSAEIDQLSLQDAIPGGDMVHNSLDLVVRTNVTTGYQLTMRDTDTDTDLAQVDGAGKIPTLESSVIATEFPSSRWGYAVGEYSDTLEFSGIPSATAETAALISKSASSLPNEGETTTVTFGARIGAELEPGQYEGSVMFTVVPELMPEEPEPTPEQKAFFEMNKIQDMTTAICNAATTPSAEATLYDEDGSHIGDQNYIPRMQLEDERQVDSSYLIQKMADGKCWMISDLDFHLTANDTLWDTETDISSGWTPEHDTQMYEGEEEWEGVRATTDRSYSNQQRTYYNWFAATAGTSANTSSDGDIASGSVCPSGWALPSNTEFERLLLAYNITNNATGAAKARSVIGLNMTGHYSYGNNGSIKDASRGYYWTRVDGGYDSAYNLYIDSSSVLISSEDQGWGQTIRCVAK